MITAESIADNIGRDTNIAIVTLYRHIKTTQQRTIIQQYGDWYT